MFAIGCCAKYDKNLLFDKCLPTTLKKIMDVHENVNWLKKSVVCCSINYVIGQKWFEGLFPLIFKKNKIWGQENQSFRYWQF